MIEILSDFLSSLCIRSVRREIMRALWTVVMGCVLVSGWASAQERVPDKELGKYCIGLTLNANILVMDPNVKVTADALKGSAVMVKDKEQIALVIPDAKLAEGVAAVSDKSVTPFAHLWFKDLVPQSEGKAIAADKLRKLKIQAGKESLEADLCFVGLQKNAKGDLELLIYGKGKEPILKPVLEAHEEAQDKPLLLDLEVPADKPMVLTIRVLGKYRTKIEVASAGK